MHHYRQRNRHTGLLLFLACTTVFAAERSPARWEKAIRAFEARDKAAPPPRNAVLFIGSSSIRGWDLKKHFPGVTAINRGFGGSFVSDSVAFAPRIAIPYAPRIIVLYAGDNDIASGKSPQTVLKDFQTFTRVIHARLPATRIVYIAIKPSLARWHLVGTMRGANALIRAETAKDRRLSYVDIDTPMLGKDGRPRKELFVADGLHLSHEGYLLWSELVRRQLEARAPQGAPTNDSTSRERAEP